MLAAAGDHSDFRFWHQRLHWKPCGEEALDSFRLNDALANTGYFSDGALPNTDITRQADPATP
jgi:hypothetical protein